MIKTLSAMTTGFVCALTVAATIYASTWIAQAMTKAVHAMTTVMENSSLNH